MITAVPCGYMRHFEPVATVLATRQVANASDASCHRWWCDMIRKPHVLDKFHSKNRKSRGAAIIFWCNAPLAIKAKQTMINNVPHKICFLQWKVIKNQNVSLFLCAGDSVQSFCDLQSRSRFLFFVHPLFLRMDETISYRWWKISYLWRWSTFNITPGSSFYHFKFSCWHLDFEQFIFELVIESNKNK